MCQNHNHSFDIQIVLFFKEATMYSVYPLQNTNIKNKSYKTLLSDNQCLVWIALKTVFHVFHVNGGNGMAGVLSETQGRPGKERQFMRVARCQSPEGETCQREVWSCSDMPLSHECCCILGLYLDTDSLWLFYPWFILTPSCLSLMFFHYISNSSVIIHSIDWKARFFDGWY